MAKVTFKRIESKNNIDNIEVSDGQFIVSKDGNIFVDYGEERVLVGTMNDDDPYTVYYEEIGVIDDVTGEVTLNEEA